MRAPHRLAYAISPVMRPHAAESPVTQRVLTYPVLLLLVFFMMGGYMLSSASRGGPLQTASSAADTLMGQLYQAAVWLIALIMMVPRLRPILAACTQMRAMTCIPLFAMLSALWSQDPANSLRKGLLLLLGTLFAYYLVQRFSALDLAQIFVFAGVCAGLLGIAVSVLLPQYGRDTYNGDAWQGIFRAKNPCAQIMLYLLTPALAFKFPSRGMAMLRLSLFPLAAVLILMSRAKTSWLLAPILIAIMALLSALRRFHRKDVLFLLVTGIAVLFVTGLTSPYIVPWVVSSLGKDPNMSGRVPLWAAAIVSILKRPLLGYGYAAFWTGLRGESLNVFMTTRFEIYQAQNGLLEVWLELGLAGVVLVAFTLVGAIRDALIAIQHDHTSATNWYIGILALTLMYNVDEASLATAHCLPWLMYTVACAGLRQQAVAARRRSTPLTQTNYLHTPLYAESRCAA